MSNSPQPRFNNNTWIANTPSPTVFVFLHGILSSSHACWYNERASSYWPLMVSKDPDLQSPSVFVAGYTSDIHSGTYDIDDAAVDVLRELRQSGRPASPLTKPRIIFICHSQGGIVLRRMLTANVDTFRNKKIGILFCGSPSWGSFWATAIAPLTRIIGFQQAIALGWDRQELKRLDRDFFQIISGKLIPQLDGLSLLESRGILPFLPKIVPDASSSRYFRWVRIAKTTHKSLVKPDGFAHPSHRWLVDFSIENGFMARSHSVVSGSELAPRVASVGYTRDIVHPAQENAVPAQAPPLPVYFVRRDAEWRKVWKELSSGRSGNGTLRISAIHGQGGLGKSTLAAAIARSAEIATRFPDGVFWITLGSDPQILPLIMSWVHAAGERTTTAWSTQSATGYLRTLLKDRSALLVIDDVWSELDARPFLVGGERCHALVTTRRTQVVDDLGATFIALAEMNSVESCELLTKRSLRSEPNKELPLEDRAKAENLAKELGHLPLALDLVGAVVARGISWSDARRRIASDETHVRGSPDRIMQRIDACLALSLERIRRDSPKSGEAFIFLALIPPEQELRANFLKTLWCVSEDEAYQMLTEFSEDALIANQGEVFRMHSLVHAMLMRAFPLPKPTGCGVTLQEGHSLVLLRYRELLRGPHWDTLPDDGYIHSRLVRHLYLAGNYREIYELLTHSDQRQGNAWYQTRLMMGQLAGYLDDLRTAQKASRRFSVDNVADQILWSLCISSVRSRTINYAPDLIYALVVSGHWKATWAKHWISEVCAQSQQPNYLLSLAEAATAIPIEIDSHRVGLDELKADCLQSAFHMAQHRGPTTVAIHLVAKVIKAMSREQGYAAASAALKWCTKEEDKGALLRALPRQLGLDLVESVSATALQSEDVRRFGLLASLITLLPADRRAVFYEPFFEYGRKLNGTKRSEWGGARRRGEGGDSEIGERTIEPSRDPSKSQISEGADGREQDVSSVNDIPMAVAPGRALVVVAPSGDTKPEEVAREDSRDSENDDDRMVFIKALRRIVLLIPSNLMLRAHLEFSDLGDPAITADLHHLFKVGQNTRRLPDEDHVDAESEQQFDFFLGTRRYFAALELIQDGKVVPSRLKEIFERVDGSAVDRMCGATARLMRSLGSEFVDELAAISSSKASGGILPLALASRTSTEALASASAYILRPDVDASVSVIVCLYFGTRVLADMALERYSRINDKKEEAASVFSMISYLPQPLPTGLVEGLDDEKSIGPKIASLTQMLVAVSKNIDGAALSELVESAAKYHSEWWVVEALIMTLLRIDREDAVGAIQIAGRHIRNADLRARLSSRLAIRCADLGFTKLALNTAENIDLECSRWDSLVGLARRFASVGNFVSAKVAASMIICSADRSRAYTEVVLELAAQGNHLEALRLIDTVVGDAEWKRVARQLIGDGKSSTAVTTIKHLSERITNRRASEAISERRAKVLESLREAAELLGGRADLLGLCKAANDGGLDELRVAFARTWSNDAPDSLVVNLNRLHRPQVLKVIAALGPVLGDGNADRAVNIVRAVRSTCNWWP